MQGLLNIRKCVILWLCLILAPTVGTADISQKIMTNYHFFVMMGIFFNKWSQTVQQNHTVAIFIFVKT